MAKFVRFEIMAQKNPYSKIQEIWEWESRGAIWVNPEFVRYFRPALQQDRIIPGVFVIELSDEASFYVEGHSDSIHAKLAAA